MVSAPDKNLWVAASDGDLARVQHLISLGASANDKDGNSYSPMHAAASYAHLELLDYLLSVGGDVNLADDDGDTPLFIVESVAAARWLIEHGADPRHQNEEGLTAADTLADDHPDVAAYLRGITGEAVEPTTTAEGPSQHAVDTFASQQTSNLMEEARAIIEQAERDGVDPDERLREVVQRAVREGFQYGGDLGEVSAPDAGAESDNKRSRDQ